jgi:hypothetical protein
MVPELQVMLSPGFGTQLAGGEAGSVTTYFTERVQYDGIL